MCHWLLVPLFAFFHLFRPPLTTYTQMVDRVSSSVVRITGMSETYVCSGTVVTVGRVLTAAHCTPSRVLADGLMSRVIVTSSFYDLTLLQVDTPKPPLTLRNADVTRFESLTAIGYAWGLTRLSVLSERAFLLNVVPPYERIDSETERAPGLVVQGGYIPGMSGGPVVDAHGELVGIVQQSNNGIGFGVSTPLIKAFLLGT